MSATRILFPVTKPVKGLEDIKFTSVVFDPEGNVPVESLTTEHPHGIRVRGGLAVDSSYEPRSHPYACSVQIERGEGLFYLDGREYAYRPGVIFNVGANIKHGFMLVASPTLFIKDVVDFTHRP